jgi:hypothetical protein
VQQRNRSEVDAAQPNWALGRHDDGGGWDEIVGGRVLRLETDHRDDVRRLGGTRVLDLEFGEHYLAGRGIDHRGEGADDGGHGLRLKSGTTSVG